MQLESGVLAFLCIGGVIGVPHATSPAFFPRRLKRSPAGSSPGPISGPLFTAEGLPASEKPGENRQVGISAIDEARLSVREGTS